MKNYIRLLRPRHALKNVLVLLPAVFSRRLFEPAVLRASVLGFAAFCLTASLIYIVNDIRDRERDRLHPTKRDRPIASGAVSVPQALAEAGVLLACLVALGLAGKFSIAAWGCLCAYLAVNVGYSFGLKNVPILDIALLVSGFILRVVFGAAVTGIEISGWLYLTVTAVSFYMGLGKRRNELLRQSDTTRRVLQYYNYEFLNKNMQMCMGLAIVFYSLWSVSAEVRYLVWTVPFVICICLKYSLTVEGDSDGDPVEVIFHDRALMAMAAAFGLLTMALLYL